MTCFSFLKAVWQKVAQKNVDQRNNTFDDAVEELLVAAVVEQDRQDRQDKQDKLVTFPQLDAE